MEEEIQAMDLPRALMIAGIEELELHGLHDFSLRRVASKCGVSCAAPYRHYKSKEDLILSIISYINKQWMLLQNQIVESFPGDVRRQLIEICVSNIRFWIANPNFRSIMMTDERGLDSVQLTERLKISSETRALIHQYCEQYHISPEQEKQRFFMIRSILYGATQMLGCGEISNTPEQMQMIRLLIERELVVSEV